jgi:hypothetical protein
MKLHNFTTFLRENDRNDVLTSSEIVKYITEITPNDSDVPDYSFKQIKESGKNFIRTKVKITDLLAADSSLKEYVDSKEQRYGPDGESDIEPDIDDLEYPIVIFNREVVDGYNRVSVHYHSGEEYITAYVSK